MPEASIATDLALSERGVPNWRIQLAESLRFDGEVAADAPDASPRLHVEVPGAGFALTLPEGWEVTIPRPDVAVDTGRAVLDAREPDIGACSVFWWEQQREGDVEWDDRHGFVDMYLSTSQMLSGGHTRTEVDLPAGPATRIDDRVPELDRHRTDFLLTDREGYYALTCQADDVPVYDPLAVAETIEFLDGGDDTLPG